MTIENLEWMTVGALCSAAVALAVAVIDFVERSRAITGEFLVGLGFSPPAVPDSLFPEYSLLIDAVDGQGAILEVRICLHCADEDFAGPHVNLYQGVPDDPNVPDDHVAIVSKRIRTAGDVLDLLQGLR